MIETTEIETTEIETTKIETDILKYVKFRYFAILVLMESNNNVVVYIDCHWNIIAHKCQAPKWTKV
jgi:hypothetical protein